MDFITRNYFPSNIVLIANGNVDHDAIVKFADEYMKNLNIDFVEYQKGYDKFKKHDYNLVQTYQMINTFVLYLIL